MSILVAVLAVVAIYVTAVLVWPFTSCRRCGEAGKHRSPSGRAWRRCKKCGGTGQKLRFGRRLLSFLISTYQRGTQ